MLSDDESTALIDALAAKLGLPKFAIAGNSLGGGVAWQFALRYPARLRALILVDAAGWPSETLKSPPLAFRLLQYSWGRAFLKSIDNTPLIRSGLRGEVGNPAVITDAFIARWAEFQRAPGHRDILMSLAPGKLGVATKEALSHIAVADADPLGCRRSADRRGKRAQIRRCHSGRQADRLSRHRPSAAGRDPGAFGRRRRGVPFGPAPLKERPPQAVTPW